MPRSLWKIVGLPLWVVAVSSCGPQHLVSDEYSGTQKPEESHSSSFSYQEYIDAVYNKRDPTAIDRYFTSDVVVHSVTPGVEGGTGTDYLKQLAKSLLDTFPDLHISVDEVVRDGDKLAARVTLEGTQKGEFMGVKPTDRKITAANFATYHLRGEKIAEVWSLVDIASIRRQLTEKQ
jgi:predicted ester cyclase